MNAPLPPPTSPMLRGLFDINILEMRQFRQTALTGQGAIFSGIFPKRLRATIQQGYKPLLTMRKMNCRLENNFCRVLLCGLITLFATGCQSVGVFHGVMPSVCGRVLASDTRQPLAGVRVIRVVPGQGAGGRAPVKGAELLQQEPPILTDATGRFVLPGKTYLLWLRPSGRSTVRLALQARGYTAFQTNVVPPKVSGSNPAPEPKIFVGDIWLKPVAH